MRRSQGAGAPPERCGRNLGYVRGNPGTLADAGCARIYADPRTPLFNDGPALLRVLAALTPGDTLTVASVGDLTEFYPQFVAITSELGRRQITLRSIADGADSTTAAGRRQLARSGINADDEAAVLGGEDAYQAAYGPLECWRRTCERIREDEARSALGAELAAIERDTEEMEAYLSDGHISERQMEVWLAHTGARRKLATRRLGRLGGSPMRPEPLPRLSGIQAAFF